MYKDQELTIIIPCYNEEDAIYDTILSVYNLLDSAGISASIMVVNDGSTDNSSEEIKRASDYAELINLPRNHGYGYAIKTGLRHAKSEWIAIIDADLTYHPKDLITIWQEREVADMIVGARTGKRVNIPLLRRPMKYILRKFAGWLAGESIDDLNSGIRLFKKIDASRFLKLYPDGFSFTTTITMSYLSSQLSIRFIPIDYNKRKGKSKIRPLHDSYQFILLLMKLAVYYNPLKVFIPIAFSLFFLSLLSIIYDIFIIRNLGDKTVLLITLGLITFLLGLIADLIIKRTQ